MDLTGAAGATHAGRAVTAAETDLKLAALRQEVVSAVGRFQQVAADAATYDDTKSQLDTFRKQSGALQKERDDAVSKYEALAATASNAAAVQQQLDLVQQDKVYLTREVDGLKQRLHRAEEAADAAMPQLEELKNQKQQLYDRLLAVREEVSGGLDRRVEDELQVIHAYALPLHALYRYFGGLTVPFLWFAAPQTESRARQPDRPGPRARDVRARSQRAEGGARLGAGGRRAPVGQPAVCGRFP